MKTILVAGLSILALVVGITGMTSGHFAEAKGMPIHNPNWASVPAQLVRGLPIHGVQKV